MAGVIQVPAPGGTTCCDCAIQVDCGCGAGCVMKCRSISGSATFCGFGEFPGHVSTPPIFYRLASLGGNCSFGCGLSEGCSPGHQNDCHRTFTYGGSCSYDKNTCALTIAGTMTTGGDCEPNFVAPRCDIENTDLVAFGINIGYPDIFSSNSHTFDNSGAGVCETNPSGFVGCIGSAASCQNILSNPDTIEDALLRSTGPDPAWNENDGGNCLQNTSFSTTWGGSGIFTFRKSQVQVTIPFAIVGREYAVQIILLERTTGTAAPFTPFGLLELTISATLTGAASQWVDLPDEAGLEILAGSCTATVVP